MGTPGLVGGTPTRATGTVALPEQRGVPAIKRHCAMTRFRFIFRSLCFHARSHVGAFLGAAVGAAVLVGALVVGDSVRGSLRELALLRLGKTELAMATGDRLFTTFLGFSLQQALSQAGLGRPGSAPLAVALQLPAVAVNADESARANQAQVLGVDGRFWQLAPTPPPLGELPPDTAVLSEALARQLHARAGDTVVLRVRKPQALSADAPLSPVEDETVALRVRVQTVVTDAQFGRFGLRANQVAPLNAFVSLPWLQARTGATNRANLLLVGEPPPPPLPQGSAAGSTIVFSGMQPLDLNRQMPIVLTQRWQLADAQLEWRGVVSAGALELRSPRVFLDPVLNDVVFGTAGDTNAIAARLRREGTGVSATGVLTYFVNELRRGDRATPYSMVTATGAPLVPPDMPDDEILINQWLADDLAAKPGDEIALKYFVVGDLRQLEEKSARFRVRAVLPMNTRGLDPQLMPDFPGMTGAENCRDWDTGLPIDNRRIRPQDEDYWRLFRGTPKAVITLRAGQRRWQNRWGNLTAIRFQVPNAVMANAGTVTRLLPGYQASISGMITRAIDPAVFGLRFQPVREQALAASSQSQDFGQLFLGFSFFLIAAALLLLAVLFQFSIEQRATELGTLLALGFRPRQAGTLLLLESGCVALAGCVVGAGGGISYARAVLHGLSTVWSQAVGGVALSYHAEPATLAIGIASAAAVSWLTLWLALRRHLRVPARQLLAEGVAETDEWAAGGRRGRRSQWVALLCLLGAAGIVGEALARQDTADAELFFSAGALLLIGGLAGASAGLRRLAGSGSAAGLSLRGMGIRGVTRRRRRSLAVIGLLACGSFLVASIGVFRLDAVRGADRRDSGTGGFALIGSATQPVIQDLNSAAGRDAYGLNTNTLAGVNVVPFRVRDGDEASCLNLNRAQAPRLLGVKPELLADRGAFTFATLAAGADEKHPWLTLKRGEFHPIHGQPLAADEVAAIGDAASIVYALGKKVGDTLAYTDEHGRPFKLRLVGALANSILQGSLVIDEAEFVRRFPSTTGCRFFLVDAPPGKSVAVAAEFTRGLRDLGLELTPAPERLAAFNAVQNTYLGTFQVLGGLGLLLGSVGLGVVVLRNVLERRGELALLLAVGFRRRALRTLVLSEHLALLLAGLGVGVAAALVAVLPNVLGGGGDLPYRSLGLTLLAILLNGAAWTWLAGEIALRGRLLTALRNT